MLHREFLVTSLLSPEKQLLGVSSVYDATTLIDVDGQCDSLANILDEVASYTPIGPDPISTQKASLMRPQVNIHSLS
jgi:hypothetical protein